MVNADQHKKISIVGFRVQVENVDGREAIRLVGLCRSP